MYILKFNTHIYIIILYLKLTNSLKNLGKAIIIVYYYPNTISVEL